jgi:hypothetical protein
LPIDLRQPDAVNGGGDARTKRQFMCNMINCPGRAHQRYANRDIARMHVAARSRGWGDGTDAAPIRANDDDAGIPGLD